MSDTPVIPLATLLQWLDDGQELAFIDVREEGLYGEGHPLLAVNVPYSVLETALPPLVPRLNTRLALYAETPADAERAARRLAALGYSRVHRFDGGIDAWRAGGHALFSGVNVPSKAFAECVEHSLHTPAIDAASLDRLIASQADYVLLDSRTVEEYERFHVPTAVAVPSAELVYRFADLVPSPDTLVVVTCAGRTRGIVGAQTLINAQIPNRVVALAGGTQGWRLSGLATTTEAPRFFPALSEAAREAALARARGVAERYAVPRIDAATLTQWQADPERTTYVFDVRNADEYAAGHRADAIWGAGGQLVQALDKWVATRNARLVLNDTDGVRATTTAHWLRQLGWEAYVLPEVAPGAGVAARHPALREVPAPLPVASAAPLLAVGAVLWSAQRSAAYRRGHPAGARWANRARLADLLRQLPRQQPLLVFADEPGLAEGIAIDALEAGIDTYVVAGSPADWAALGHEWQASPGVPEDDQRLDYLFWLHDRHDGNLEASAAYIAWEEDLPRQVGDHANARFRIQP